MANRALGFDDDDDDDNADDDDVDVSLPHLVSSVSLVNCRSISFFARVLLSPFDSDRSASVLMRLNPGEV